MKLQAMYDWDGGQACIPAGMGARDGGQALPYPGREWGQVCILKVASYPADGDKIQSWL